jgi:hypothetical protein
MNQDNSGFAESHPLSAANNYSLPLLCSNKENVEGGFVQLPAPEKISKKEALPTTTPINLFLFNHKNGGSSQSSF